MVDSRLKGRWSGTNQCGLAPLATLVGLAWGSRGSSCVALGPLICPPSCFGLRSPLPNLTRSAAAPAVAATLLFLFSIFILHILHPGVQSFHSEYFDTLILRFRCPYPPHPPSLPSTRYTRYHRQGTITVRPPNTCLHSPAGCTLVNRKFLRSLIAAATVFV